MQGYAIYNEKPFFQTTIGNESSAAVQKLENITFSKSFFFLLLFQLILCTCLGKILRYVYNLYSQ